MRTASAALAQARAARLARVRFVALPFEPAAPRRGALAVLRELVSRVLGRLEAARP